MCGAMPKTIPVRMDTSTSCTLQSIVPRRAPVLIFPLRASAQPASLTHLLSRNLPLPKYFSSSPSTALYRLPRKNPHAFASTVSAAAEAAWLPSMKMREAVEEDGEWSERFIVCWLEVEVTVDAEGLDDEGRPVSAVKHGKRPAAGSRKASTSSISGLSSQRDLDPGIGPGTREERRSLGSGETSRTATPTTPRRDTFKPKGAAQPHLARMSSGGSTTRHPPSQVDHTLYRGSGSGKAKAQDGQRSIRVAPTSDGGDAKRTTCTKMERQLVAITFGGDWYRLRIPDEVEHDDEGQPVKKTGRKCELVEYRRLNVGGGGW